MQAKPTVAVVMCTYNGAPHIRAQLASIAAQTWPFTLYVFDDDSSDDTAIIVDSFKDKIELNFFRNENNLGYVANFEAGIAKVLTDGFEYIAISDQDDVWDADRITKGMEPLLAMESKYGKQAPAVVHSDLAMIDVNEKLVHHSFFAYRAYSITNERSGAGTACLALPRSITCA